MTFGDLIRQHRHERGLTLLEVAAQIDISVPYLSRIERNREYAPNDDMIRRLAAVLNIAEDDAFGAAGRLPPDLQKRARDVFAHYRRMSQLR